MTTPTTDPNVLQMLQELSRVSGQLDAINKTLNYQADATNRRIDDMRASIETRFDSVEKRLSTLEQNERGTATRTAAVGALSGALVTAGMQLLRHLP
jgi:chaperonin cofactor prefoldin